MQCRSKSTFGTWRSMSLQLSWSASCAAGAFALRVSLSARCPGVTWPAGWRHAYCARTKMLRRVRSLLPFSCGIQALQMVPMRPCVRARLRRRRHEPQRLLRLLPQRNRQTPSLWLLPPCLLVQLLAGSRQGVRPCDCRPRRQKPHLQQPHLQQQPRRRASCCCQ